VLFGDSNGVGVGICCRLFCLLRKTKEEGNVRPYLVGFAEFHHVVDGTAVVLFVSAKQNLCVGILGADEGVNYTQVSKDVEI
jgi:hypothetical protein